MNKKIIFSAGGTGGHIFPAINLMKHFFERGYEVALVTDKKGSNFLKKKTPEADSEAHQCLKTPQNHGRILNSKKGGHFNKKKTPGAPKEGNPKD